MWAMKTNGGLTKGLQISSTCSRPTLGRWVRAVPLCIPMCEALEELAGTHCETSDQYSLHNDHAELRQARVIRDDTDRKHMWMAEIP